MASYVPVGLTRTFNSGAILSLKRNSSNSRGRFLGGFRDDSAASDFSCNLVRRHAALPMPYPPTTTTEHA